jgi:hypothetical protein
MGDWFQFSARRVPTFCQMERMKKKITTSGEIHSYSEFPTNQSWRQTDFGS